MRNGQILFEVLRYREWSECSEVIKTNLVKTVTTCHLSHLSGAVWSFLLAEKEMIQETVLTAFYYQIKILSWTPRSSHNISQDHITGSCQSIITQDHIKEKRKNTKKKWEILLALKNRMMRLFFSIV